MTIAHLLVFSDGCPSDWLGPNVDSQEWRTYVCLCLQMGCLPVLLDDGTVDVDLLVRDRLYCEFFECFERQLGGKLKKWSDGGGDSGYRKRFQTAFVQFQPALPVWVNALSFRECDLRQSQDPILSAYNSHSGMNNTIGFQEIVDARGRITMQHEFLSMHGYHKLSRPKEQVLVLLAQAWSLNDQYLFYRKKLREEATRNGWDLLMTVASDTLSGDNYKRRDAEYILRHLLDPYREPPIRFGRIAKKTELGNLFVDNIAGWMNECLCEPMGDSAKTALLADDRLCGWNELIAGETWTTSSILNRLREIQAAQSFPFAK